MCEHIGLNNKIKYIVHKKYMTLISDAKNKGINSTIASSIAMSFIVGLNDSKSIVIFTYRSYFYLYNVII